MPRRTAATEWAANIVRLLGGKGWNQRELAEKAGLSTNQITALITKEGNPQIKQLRKVAEAFGVPVWQLFLTADLAARTTEGVELGASLTPVSDSYDAPKEGQTQTQALPPRIEIPEPTLRRALLGAIRDLATAPYADEHIRRDANEIVRRAAERQQAAPADGSTATGTTHRARRRRTADR